jgi:hypothetical protein
MPPCDESISEQCLKPASPKEIKQAIHAVYDAAEKSGAKPPNINELPTQVQNLLASSGHTATGRQIKEFGDQPVFSRRRRPRGKTLKSEQRRG